MHASPETFLNMNIKMLQFYEVFMQN